jgi:sortase (surface protein transpeptidase)
MQVPADFGLTGWFTGSPAPGATGPAVIVGHIDSRSGPAVFYRLPELRPGDRVVVARADGTTVRFAVDSVAQYPKRAFPTQAVFGPAPDPLLRLITCGGSFDTSRRSYRDNVVVTAHLL